jgi:2-dehydro-3-deoxygalactonokinase
VEGPKKHTIVVDWSAHFFKAWLLSPMGDVLRRINTQDGVVDVSGRQFLQVFNSLCHAWIIQHPDAQVVLMGEITTASGWKEVEGVACPVSANTLLSHTGKVSLGAGAEAQLIPSVEYKSPSGLIDHMYTSAAVALGSGLANGVVCIVGEMTRWVEIKNGMIERFYTFATSQMVDLLRRHFNLLYVTQEKIDMTSFERGLTFAWRKEDVPTSHAPETGFALKNLGNSTREKQETYPTLLRTMAELRVHQRIGHVNVRHLGSYVWGLAIGEELVHALRLFGNPQQVIFVAEDQLEIFYEKALSLLAVQTTPMKREYALTRFIKSRGTSTSDTVSFEGNASDDMDDPDLVASSSMQTGSNSRVPLSVRPFSARGEEDSENSALLPRLDATTRKEPTAASSASKSSTAFSAVKSTQSTPLPKPVGSSSKSFSNPNLSDIPFLSGLSAPFKSDQTF